MVTPRPLRRDRSEELLTYAEAIARVAASGGGAQALAAHLAASDRRRGVGRRRSMAAFGGRRDRRAHDSALDSRPRSEGCRGRRTGRARIARRTQCTRVPGSRRRSAARLVDRLSRRRPDHRRCGRDGPVDRGADRGRALARRRWRTRAQARLLGSFAGARVRRSARSPRGRASPRHRAGAGLRRGRGRGRRSRRTGRDAKERRNPARLSRHARHPDR